MQGPAIWWAFAFEAIVVRQFRFDVCLFISKAKLTIMKKLSFIAVVVAMAAFSACHQNSQNTPGTADSAEISTRESDTSLIHNKPDSTATPVDNVATDSAGGAR